MKSTSCTLLACCCLICGFGFLCLSRDAGAPHRRLQHVLQRSEAETNPKGAKRVLQGAYGDLSSNLRPSLSSETRSNEQRGSMSLESSQSQTKGLKSGHLSNDMLAQGGHQDTHLERVSLESGQSNSHVLPNDQELPGFRGEVTGTLYSEVERSVASGNLMAHAVGSVSQGSYEGIQEQVQTGDSVQSQLAGAQNSPSSEVGLAGPTHSAERLYPSHVEGYATDKLQDSTAASADQYASSLGSQLSTVAFSQLPAGHESHTDNIPKHGKFDIEEDAATCMPLQPQERQVSPTWISSFPGSGSKITSQLVEAITGLFTGDDLDSTGKVSKGVVVAIKTHYPSHTEEKVFKQQQFGDISRAILVISNPMNAFSRIFRFVYSVQQGAAREDDESLPPSEAWNGWKNQHFETELGLWIDHTQWWLENYKRENLHLLPYEYLTSAERGSDELQKMGNFLGSADPTIASSLIAPEKFCCLWEKLLNRGPTSSSKTPPEYTAEELESIIQALIKIRDGNKSFPEFFTLMDVYLGEVVSAKKSVIAKKRKE